MSEIIDHGIKKLNIDFVDLQAQQKHIRKDIDQAIAKVLDHGQYIMGPEVRSLEKIMSALTNGSHTISCANGTDALALCLMAKDVGPGQAIFVPSFTFVASAEVIVWTGATPIYIDVNKDTFNICAESLRKGIETAKSLNLKPSGIIAVDLFGLPADYHTLEKIAQEHNMWLMCDAAQSFGASYCGRPVGSVGDMTTTSFYPAKPLGCYGDGGAIFTHDENLAEIIKSMRVHGQGSDKYDNVRIGMNGRLDTIQAAILIEKLKVFPEEIKNRQRAADYYSNALESLVTVPRIPDQLTSVWAQYTVRLPKGIDRAKLMDYLKSYGVPTVIYYPKPLHQQKAYSQYPTAGLKPLTNSETLANEVLSLPISGYITQETQDQIIEIFKNYFVK